jgi:hypothetical protein
MSIFNTNRKMSLELHDELKIAYRAKVGERHWKPSASNECQQSLPFVTSHPKDEHVWQDPGVVEDEDARFWHEVGHDFIK